MKKPFDIVTIGSALRDTLFYTDDVVILRNPKKNLTKQTFMCVEYGAKLRSETVYQGFGGGAYNTAINFVGLGMRTSTIVSVGDDQDGELIEKNFAAHDIDTTLIQKNTAYHTGFSFLLIDTISGEHSAFIHYGAAAQLQIQQESISSIKTDWFYLSSLNTKNWKSVISRIVTHPSRFAWNPGAAQIAAGYKGLHRFFAKTHICIMNRDEAVELVFSHPTAPKKAPSVKQLLQILHGWGIGVIVITDGEKGAYAYDGKRIFFQAASGGKPKDTTGAGDCFGSSFVAGMIRYQKIQKSLLLAAKNAGSLVQKIGAQTGLLTRDQLPQSLRKELE